MNHYRQGLGSVGAYQVSAIPYLSSSILVPASAASVKLEFPQVTSFVLIKNDTGNDIEFAFSPTGFANGNYWTVESGSSISAKWKVIDIYMRGASSAATASIAAGLTSISRNELTAVGNVNWSGSVGVG